MSATKKDPFRVGAKVKVPWGLSRPLDGRIVEAWGDAAGHVRVRFRLDGDDEDLVLLLPSHVLTRA